MEISPQHAVGDKVCLFVIKVVEAAPKLVKLPGFVVLLQKVTVE